jgi:hypothetical protein
MLFWLDVFDWSKSSFSLEPMYSICISMCVGTSFSCLHGALWLGTLPLNKIDLPPRDPKKSDRAAAKKLNCRTTAVRMRRCWCRAESHSYSQGRWCRNLLHTLLLDENLLQRLSLYRIMFLGVGNSSSDPSTWTNLTILDDKAVKILTM